MSDQARIKVRRFRIGERLNARRMSETDKTNMVLSAEDESNLEEFERMIEEATTILNQEIDAINDGEFSIIRDLYERKTAVLKSIELRMPLVQPFLTTSYVRARNLPKILDKLANVARTDSALLERMALAAGTIVKEIQRATERHSLKGMYGNIGQKVTESMENQVKIDKSL
jgi:hypothetical protein